MRGRGLQLPPRPRPRWAEAFVRRDSPPKKESSVKAAQTLGILFVAATWTAIAKAESRAGNAQPPAANAPASAGNTPASAKESSPAEAAEHPLLSLNQATRAIYAEARANALVQARPVIILAGDRLILDRGNERSEASIASADYDHLKVFAHIALALDAALIDLPPDGQLGEAKCRQLEQYGKLIEAAAAEIATLDLSEKQAARQREIAATATTFIGQLLKEKHCTTQQRQAFIRGLTPLVMANVSEAAQATLEAIDTVVQRWKQDLPAAEWKRLRVIVMGRQLPRKDSLAVQYFAWLFNTQGEGERIIYAEGIPDEEGAIKLLGTHLIDTQVGIDFFDDPIRMKRDLLGDAAKETLQRWTTEKR